MIYGINGKKRSGKDALAKLMKRIDPEQVYIYKFAQPIKEAIGYGFLKLHLPISYADLDGESNYDRERLEFSLDQTFDIMDYANQYLGLDIDKVWLMEKLTELGDETSQTFSIRLLLQYYGTEIGRHTNPDIWVDLAKDVCVSKDTLHDFVLITDTRFPNEVDMIRSIGGEIIQVVRDSSTINNDTHASENSLANLVPDIVIDNNGTIEELDAKALNIIEGNT